MEQDSTNGSGQYLRFILDQESYAIAIGRVREVLEMQPVTRIPRTPDFFHGIINLRGHAVPVVDLRQKFGMEATTPTINTCIVIMEVRAAGEDIVLGTLVDAVREVFDLAGSDIEPPPRLGLRVEAGFLQGIGRVAEGFVIILDVDRVFSEEELALVRQGSGQEDSLASEMAA